MSRAATAPRLVGEASGGGQTILAPSLARPTAVRIVAFCAIGMAVNMAPAFLATFPVLMKPMQNGLGFSRTQLTTGYSLAIACLAAMGPVVGRVADLRGQRALLLVGIPALALCLALFSMLPPHGFLLYLALCATTGLVGAASFQPLYYSVLPPWFDRRLGIALALAGAGGALGIACFAAYAQRLVGLHGWRFAFQAIAATSLSIGYAGLFLLRVPKVARRSAKEHAALVDKLDGPRFAAIVRLPAFWRLAAAYLLLCTMINGNFVHLVPMLTDRGASAADAATMMVCLGVTGFVARVVCGFLLLRVEPARLGGGVFLTGVIGAALLLRADGPVQIVCAVVLMGAAFGAEGELLNYTGRFAFGLRAQAVVLGALSRAFLCGNLLGPMLMSICRDQTGNYRLAQVLLVFFGFAAAALHWGIRRTAGVIPVGSRAAITVTPEF